MSVRPGRDQSSAALPEVSSMSLHVSLTFICEFFRIRIKTIQGCMIHYWIKSVI